MNDSQLLEVKAIIFDLDNTLVHSSLAYDRALNAVGIDSNGAEYRSAKSLVKALIGAGHVSSHNRLLYFKKIQEAQKGFSPRSALDLMQAYETALELEFKMQWHQLNRDSLLGALARRYRLFILTNENLRTQLIKLRAIDPQNRYFERIFTSEEYGVEKPDPKIFEALIRETGLIPCDCLMIGDSVEADIEPAEKLGMRAILTTEYTQPASSLGIQVMTISTLLDLNGILKL